MADSPASSPQLIKIRGLSKSYNSSGARIEILKGLDFDLVQGETVAIVGASGIGKSTLLHILGTLDRPDTGAFWFKGRNVFKLDDIELAKLRNRSIGFVFQFHYLLPEFSAVENVMMPLLIQGNSKKTAKAAAEEILVRVGMRERLFHRVNKLSGGEQQRVALARALILKPNILLADEPTGNLDRQNSEQIHALIMELNREVGMTLVAVTHNMELASCMSHSVTIMDGKLVEMN
jgi:lipoprotein-releasing system ATP-binding protein